MLLEFHRDYPLRYVLSAMRFIVVLYDYLFTTK